MKIDDSEFQNWSCLAGCPPGFSCSEDKLKRSGLSDCPNLGLLNLHWRNNFISRSIDACPSGASKPASDQCSKCPPGFICRPGEYPFPCPLGQYLNVSFNENGKVNWEGAEYDFFWDYECVDCPAGHKCGFAASEPFPCKSKSYNSHTGQMTCQECIPEFGEECSNAATSIKGLGSNNLNLLQKYWKDSI